MFLLQEITAFKILTTIGYYFLTNRIISIKKGLS
jgi:hypothetical protein